MVRPKPNQTPAGNSEQIEKFLTEQPDIRAIFKEPTYEELKVALERYLDPSSPGVATPAPAKVETTSVTAAKSASTEKKSTSVKDMIEEFDEVFN
jgi:hypothetical protein